MLWAILLSSALTVAAEEPRPVGFPELVALALRNDPERAVAIAERRAAAAAVDLARWTRWSPRVTATGTFGVVPGARGDVFSSPDTPRDLDNLGPFWRTRFDISMPVLAFGRLAEAQRAAGAALASKEAKLGARHGFVAELAARAYYGYVLARQNLELLGEVRGHLERHRQSLEQAGDEADPLDLYRVRNYGFQLDRLEAEARRGQEEARLGLRLLAGTEVAPAESELVALATDADLDAVSDEQALAANPELREAELAAEARARLARSEREVLPALAIEGRFEYGEAPGRTTQKSPFVYEPYNTRTLGAALALRWDLNFKQTGARAARAQAEADAARAKSAALATRLRFDLGRARARLREARADRETASRALGTTANWLRLAEENEGLGTASSRDVVDAYAAYLQARSAHLRAIHDLNLATVGWWAIIGRSVPEASR
jgi:outer membrane protein TolC